MRVVVADCLGFAVLSRRLRRRFGHCCRGADIHKLEQDFLDDRWSALESRCNNMAAAMRASLTEPERHAFAGFINIAFHFLPAGMTSFHHYPVYRLRTHGDGPSYDHPITEEEQTLSNDIVQICSWYVNQGLALRAPGDDYNQQPRPEVGFYKRDKKTWIWVRFRNCGWTMYNEKGKDWAHWKSSAETFRRYHALLAQRNFE